MCICRTNLYIYPGTLDTTYYTIYITYIWVRTIIDTVYISLYVNQLLQHVHMQSAGPMPFPSTDPRLTGCAIHTAFKHIYSSRIL